MTLIDFLVLGYFLVLAGLFLFALGRAHYAWKPMLILLVLSICGLMLWYPTRYGPDDRLKRGIDLAGGTTLVYEVKLPEDANPDTVIPNLISVLKDRVDPQGMRNLTWRQIAGNRIQIQMPLASENVKQLSQDYSNARAKLLESNLSQRRINSLVRADAEQRAEILSQIAPQGSELRNQLEEMLDAHQALVGATEPYEQAQQTLREARAKLRAMGGASTQPSGEKQQLQQRIERLQRELEPKARAYLEAKQHFENLRDKVLERTISEAELERALDQPIAPPTPGQPSPRKAAIDQLKEDHPQRADQIQKVADAYAAYEQNKGPLDDPNDLIAMLRGAGILEFRIAATPSGTRDGQPSNVGQYRTQLEEEGPRAGRNEPWRWFEVDDIDQFAATSDEKEALKENTASFFRGRGLVGQAYADRYYILLANTPDLAITQQQEGWELTGVSRSSDSLGQPAISFELNPRGGTLMGRLTGANTGRPMAILLDGQVLSAPTLQSKITDSGQITGGRGGFSEKELDYLLRTLQAGSPEAELANEPSMVKTTGPSLGQDNLQAGLQAAVLSLIIVGIFMLAYYFFAGAVADFALAANMIIILGVMAMFRNTFTLPGVAGVVLTIGMAVDANVLIFERIREERQRNVDLPTAIRLGFEKAFSTIIDANLTTLITCVVLYYFATPEIKGFAITLLIGILATLFTALFCTRAIVELYQRFGHPRELTMLPTVVPAIRKALSPNIDWIGKRLAFFVISTVLVVTGVIAITSRGADLLDIEFRSGTQVSFQLADGQTLSMQQVRDRLTTYADMGAAIDAGEVDTADLTPEQQQAYHDMQPIVAEYGGEASGGEGGDAGEDTGVDFSLLRGDRATVVTTGQTQGLQASGFSVSTLITNPNAVSATVKAAFDDVLDEARPVSFASSDADSVSRAPVYPVRHTELGRNIPGLTVAGQDVSDYVGGVAIWLQDMNPAPTLEDMEQRIQRMRLQPEFEELGHRPFEVIGLQTAGRAEDGTPRYSSAVVVARDNTTDYAENPDAFTNAGGLADTEFALVSAALQRDTSLDSVSNFDASVSRTMQQQATAALVLSLLAVIAYIWFRFGSIQYGLAAIVALVHDVTIALGLLAIAGYLAETFLGQLLLLDAFKINLAVIAALLTIVGYSLNDTIVVFDRIRENRGRLAIATPAIINDSINQTISRTVLTSGTTLLAVGILYVFGGGGIHAFAFAVLIGVMIGTYSSVAVAAPTLLLGPAHRRAAAKEAENKSAAPTPAAS